MKFLKYISNLKLIKTELIDDWLFSVLNFVFIKEYIKIYFEQFKFINHHYFLPLNISMA